MSKIKNIKLNGTNISLEEKEIKKIRYNGDEYTIGGMTGNNDIIMDTSNTVGVISWDGNIDGKTYIDLTPLLGNEAYYVKISDAIYTASQATENEIYRFEHWNLNSYKEEDLAVIDFETQGGFVGLVEANNPNTYFVLFIHDTNKATAAFNSIGYPITIPSTGCYILYIPMNAGWNIETVVLGRLGLSGMIPLIEGTCSYLVVPKGTKNIRQNAFYNCNWVKTLDLPDSILYIDSNAFYGMSSMNNLVIKSKTLYNVGVGAFANCTSLQTLTFKAKTPPTFPTGQYYTSQFMGCFSLTAIKVPAESISLYTEALTDVKFYNNDNVEISAADIVVADDSE